MFVDCPADELAPCYFYEYSRESKSLREMCANDRPGIPVGASNGFDYYLSTPWSTAQEELMADPARTFMLGLNGRINRICKFQQKNDGDGYDGQRKTTLRLLT